MTSDCSHFNRELTCSDMSQDLSADVLHLFYRNQVAVYKVTRNQNSLPQSTKVQANSRANRSGEAVVRRQINIGHFEKVLQKALLQNTETKQERSVDRIVS